MDKVPKSLQQWLHQLETSHNKKIDLGLDRVSAVYASLALEKIAPTIITVAGTNGKGSTVAILTSICDQAGLSVGTFTSPHVLEFNERITLNKISVADAEIIQAFERIEQHLNGVTLSYFEYATLAALWIFKQQAVDVAILEVGLGGRLDSVNVVDTDCAIITTIDIDHTQWLGDNIESIAHEKAGIMRPHKAAIFGDYPCPQAIIKHAEKIKAHLLLTDSSLTHHNTNLIGDYQQKNIKTALTALTTLKLPITSAHITQGLNHVQLQARLQTIAHNPDVIVDVSHNAQAAQQLAQWLKKNPIAGKTFAVFAVLNDKNATAWLGLFEHLIDVWCISQVNSERSMHKQDLRMALAETAAQISTFTSITQAYSAAKIMAQAEDRILVFGSFYVVGEVLAG